MIEKKIPVTNNKLLGRLTRLPPKYIYITPIVSQTRITCINHIVKSEQKYNAGQHQKKLPVFLKQLNLFALLLNYLSLF